MFAELVTHHLSELNALENNASDDDKRGKITKLNERWENALSRHEELRQREMNTI